MSLGAVRIDAWRHGRTWHGMFGERQTKVQNGEKDGESDGGMRLGFSQVPWEFLNKMQLVCPPGPLQQPV